MATSQTKTPFLAVLIMCLVISGGKSDDVVEFEEYLNVPASEFVGSVRSTIGIVEQVMSILSQFSGMFGDFRVKNAISDCLDLMDMSVDQLSWTLSTSQNPNGKDNSTGNVSSDMKTRLSGTLTNQDTCKDGFDGTSNTLVESLIVNLLDQVTSLVFDILSAVKPTPTTTPPKNGGGTGKGGGGGRGGRKLMTYNKYPEWVRSHDRKLLQSSNGATADAVVAADGTGQFMTIEDAVKAAPEYSSKRYIIYVKRGVYKEYVEIGKKKWNIMMIGDGVNATVISGNRNFIDGWTTYRSATFAVKGQGFIARDITFENNAGPEKHQAVAFRSDSDLSVLYRCAFKGYQDTLYAHSQRQFYRECKITGTVDFIFGNGAVVFQNCEILGRKGLPSQKNTVTAQGRKESVENTGFSIQFCNISVEPDVPVNSTLTYLGRPWKLYSRTVIMQSYISDAIRPAGWLEWDGNFALDTLYYGEFMNFGPGAGLGNRVNWTGYHTFNDSSQASNFTVSQFLLGNTWLPSTGVKYTAGLTT